MAIGGHVSRSQKLNSVDATLLGSAGCIFCELRNGKLQKTIEESENRIKELEAELKDFREQQRIAKETSQDKNEKKPPKKIDFTGVLCANFSISTPPKGEKT